MCTFKFILCCCVLWIQLKKVVSLEGLPNSEDAQNVSTRHSFSGDKLLIEGIFVNSSDIKRLINNRIIPKICVHVVNTFYVDDDLPMQGVEEFEIFADTWNILREVTFELSGLDGTNQELSTVKGAPGIPGNAGKNGGNFFGLANKVIKGAFLTVKLNGGNGGDGQDGTASDDVQVIFNETEHSGDAGWFSTADLYNYYQSYFKEKGYDPDISHINEHTSLYAVFVQDINVDFQVRLHPQKCCGTTGIGGVGGSAGRSGRYNFKKIGNDDANGSPKFITNDGYDGKSGKNAAICNSSSIDVRIETKLKKNVSLLFPMHHSFSSSFSIVDHISSSSKCPIQYVKSSETIVRPVQHTIEIVPAIVEYKTFLLEHMKSSSLKEITQKTFNAIDSDQDINDEYSVGAFVDEANEIEKRYLELKKSVEMLPLYESLIRRIPSSDRRTDKGLSQLHAILSFRLRDFKDVFGKKGVIVKMEGYIEVAILSIDLQNSRTIVRKSDLTDVKLRNKINKLESNVKANNMLSEYYYTLNGYKIIFFPFSAEFLENFQLSPSLDSYPDLNAIVSATTINLRSMNEGIHDMNYYSKHLRTNKTSSDNNDPDKSFYIWKNAEIRNEIRRLFAGEKVQLLADIKRSKHRFNAFKLNRIELVFRTSDQATNNRLNEALKHFVVDSDHSGESAFRCNNKFYKITTNSYKMPYKTVAYEKLQENRPFLSPYTLWGFQLSSVDYGLRSRRAGPFSTLAPFVELVDIELHATGEYIIENASICDNSSLDKFYSRLYD